MITISDFQDSGISAAKGALFTDFIPAHIVRTGKYTVIDRTQRQVILGEIEFSYANCTDEACQLQIGRLLAATQIIVGSLGKFGAGFILNIKLVEVATGRSASAASRVYGSLEELLEDSQGLTLALLGIESDAASPTAPAAASPIAPTAADATTSAGTYRPDGRSPVGR